MVHRQLGRQHSGPYSDALNSIRNPGTPANRCQLFQQQRKRQRQRGPQGGKGFGNPGIPNNTMQYHFAMMMKAMKGGGKGYPGFQQSGNQQSTGSQMKGKGGGKSDSRECFNCGGKGHIARNCPHPKRESRIQTRAIEEADDEVCWGANMIDELHDVHSTTGETLSVVK